MLISKGAPCYFGPDIEIGFPLNGYIKRDAFVKGSRDLENVGRAI